jgi:murein L,D-transpeptidase YcbB/YkuD
VAEGFYVKHRWMLMLAAASLAGPAAAVGHQPLEPIDLPPSIEQGVDMIYIDPELAPRDGPQGEMVFDAGFDNVDGPPVDFLAPANTIYTDLRRGLVRYRMRWGSLPQIDIPAGPVLKLGTSGERVAMLRQRLGLAPSDTFDAALDKVVREYQDVHGLTSDGIAGSGTVDSLNLGAEHYERILMINLERARRLPVGNKQDRYALVDAGNAKLYLFDHGRAIDSMRVIVGAEETATPMMAAYIRYADVNPYWNVPPELIHKMVAPNVLKGGLQYLTDRDYEIYSNWTDDAVPVDPRSVDWQALADGKPTQLRFRRGPGPWNSMGKVKFMLPNDFGIYLHDYPDKHKFELDDRWISNGCVRLEDADRLAKFLFGYVPEGKNPKVEEHVDLPHPVPVYMTYLTAEATPTGVRFRTDHYHRDAALLARYSDGPDRIASAAGR